MKRKIYSIIVIICTVISVMIMTYFNRSTSIINGFKLYEFDNQETVESSSEQYVDSEHKEINNEISSKEKHVENQSDDGVTVDANNTTKIEEDAEIMTESKNENAVLDSSSNDMEEYTNSNYYNNSYSNSYRNNDTYEYYSSNSEVNTISDDEINVLLNEETASVFKVNKNTIPSKISNQDKLKMLRMANSLSIKDYRAVAENIKRNDELPAATDIFKILKDKLSSENYSELKKILNPYINFDLIEKNINKNKRWFDRKVY